MRGVVASGLVCLSVCDAFGAVSDYLRTETANYNGYDGATLVTWTKTSSPKGRAWAVKFDLTKDFRMRACYGDGSGSRATVGAMAERLFDEGCVEVGEFDGGGSATMWSVAGADSARRCGRRHVRWSTPSSLAAAESWHPAASYKVICEGGRLWI